LFDKVDTYWNLAEIMQSLVSVYLLLFNVSNFQ